MTDHAVVAAMADVLEPGDRVVVADGAGSPTSWLGELTEAARRVGDVSLVLGWTLDLPDGFDPSAFAEVRTLMGGFALRAAVQDGSVTQVPDRLSGIPATLAGPLRPDVLLAALRPTDDGWAWGSEVSWMQSVLDLPDVRLLVVEREGLPRASRLPTVPRSRGVVIARDDSPPAEGRGPAPTEVHERIAASLAGLIPAGAQVQYGPGPIADALAEALTTPVSIRSGMLTEAVRRLEQRGLLIGDPVGAYLWGGTDFYAWADERRLVDRVENTHAARPGGAPVVAINAALEVDHTGAVNVERRGDRAISGIGGHPDFALAGHLDPRGLSIVATPSTRNGESVLVPALSCAASTPRSDVDVVVTEHGVADLRGRTDAERHEALRAIFPTW